ncbi:MAG: 6-phosphofructokinase [Planctomycetia bacterium]
MKRIGILTAGGDTPALNATIHGAVERANERRVEVIGLIKGFNSLFNPRVPHVHLNPLFHAIPELDPTMGGTLLGASRDYVDGEDRDAVKQMVRRLERLKIEGLICIGGDGTLSGMQALCEYIPTVLAPKTIDNDLGLNYRNEADEWQREPDDSKKGFHYRRTASRAEFNLEQMVNFATPGYATAAFVSAWSITRLRSTAESHRRIAIVELMGRHSGYIALGSAYGQPDIILVPEHPLNLNLLVDRVKELYHLQKNVLIACAEGVVDENGKILGAERASTDPAGNVILTGAAEHLERLLSEKLGDDFFVSRRRSESARAAIFTRKVGHTQRGGRPIRFDRFHGAQLGAKAVEMLVAGQHNTISTLQWTRDAGFYVDSVHANSLCDRWRQIHARQMHPSFYDPLLMKPSKIGIEYMTTIFNNAFGPDDAEHVRTVFSPGHLLQPYHSVNIDVGKRIHFIEDGD